MFALGVELLMGRAVMARPDDRDAAEWPPHPDRVFMALVAAWGERGEHPAERAALLWLEGLRPPALAVAIGFSERTVVTSYVPVNDDASPISNKGKPQTPLGSLAFGRARNGRTFPAVAPADPVFHLVWPDDELSPDHRPALDELCAAVTYLGHSATPVRAWVTTDAPSPTLVPVPGKAEHQLRAFGPGRLVYLESQYNRAAIDEHERLTREVADLLNRHAVATVRAEKSALKKMLDAAKMTLDDRFPAGAPQTLRPRPTRWQGYARPTPPAAVEAVRGGFDPGILVFKHATGRRVGLEHGPAVALAVRNLLMSRHGADPPEWLSGHLADGPPTKQDRPAYLPLGFVGRDHADGRLMGLAVAAPKDFPREAMAHLVRLLCQEQESEDDEPPVPVLRLRTPAGELTFHLDERPDGQRGHTLRPATWTRPACSWATVTPVALPRYPRRGLSPEDVVAQACVEAGYPEPAAVRAGFAPFLTGVPHVRGFPRRAKPGRPPRPLFHALVTFPVPVVGPVLIGAGRYAGYGVCRPFAEEDRS